MSCQDRLHSGGAQPVHHPTTHSQGPAQDHRGIAGGGVGGSTPYSQHPQLLEPHKVILVDPSDVVAIEFPGGRRREGSSEVSRVSPQARGSAPGARPPGSASHLISGAGGFCEFSLCRGPTSWALFAADVQPTGTAGHRAHHWECCGNRKRGFCH